MKYYLRNILLDKVNYYKYIIGKAAGHMQHPEGVTTIGHDHDAAYNFYKEKKIMNLTDVIALSRAGFTSAQIAQMALAEQQNPTLAPAAEAVPTPAPAPAPAPATAPAPAAPAPAADNKADFDAIMAAIGGLKLQMQQAAIQTAQQPAQPQMTANDMIASIINPPTAVNDK